MDVASVKRGKILNPERFLIKSITGKSSASSMATSKLESVLL